MTEIIKHKARDRSILILALLNLQIYIFLFLYITFGEVKFPNHFESLLLTSIFFFLVFLSYFLLRCIYVSIRCFLSQERCYYENGIFYYEKILWKRWTIKKFSLDVLNIEKISDCGRRKLKLFMDFITPQYYLYYFKIYERICIQSITGEKYYIWNEEMPKWKDYDKNQIEEEIFQKDFQKISNMIKEYRDEEEHRNELKAIENQYYIFPLERYFWTLKIILKEEKVFFKKEEDVFSVNAGEEAIHHLDIFKEKKFEEMNFYQFYLDYLSNKNYENTMVRVADNGRDFQEVSMKQLKDDINKLRDEK